MNIVTPEKTIRGPTKVVPKLNALAMIMPEQVLTRPIMALSSVYLRRLLLAFFAAAAGTMTRNPTSNVPVICMPIATINDTTNK